MEFNFLHDNQNFVITVQKNAGGRLLAEIDSKKIPFEYRWISPDCLSLVIDNVSHTVFVSQSDKKFEVFINGNHFIMEDAGSKSQIGRSAEGVLSKSNENTIFAPMPGRILKILVKENQSVKMNQPLFILESMKMENEVQSPRDGKISKIHYQVNDLVSLGDPIIELEKMEIK